MWLTKAGGSDCNTCDPHDRLSKDVIYTFIPSKLKSRASTLLGSLDAVLNWNKKGEIMFDNQTVELSHIADLLKICLYNYKQFQPIGFRCFCNILAKHNIPMSLISNQSVRNEIEKIRNSFDTKSEQIQNDSVVSSCTPNTKNSNWISL